MNKVLVLGTNRKPLMPCYPARARKLLKSGRASVFRRYGFPRTKAKPRTKNFFGFKTGDMVKVTIPEGAKTKIPVGTYVGRVAARSSGHFDVKTKNTKITVPYRYCKLIHLMDGYSYA